MMQVQGQKFLKVFRRRDPIVRHALLLAFISIVASVEVNPDDGSWKTSVEEAPAGTTISFASGIYFGCNIAVPTGVTLAAKHSVSCPPGSTSLVNCTGTVTIDCNSDARYVLSMHRKFMYEATPLLS